MARIATATANPTNANRIKALWTVDWAERDQRQQQDRPELTYRHGGQQEGAKARAQLA